MEGKHANSLVAVLAVFDALSIPAHFKELANTGPGASIFGVPIGPNPSRFEYEVWVFRSDLEKAKRAIQNIF